MEPTLEKPKRDFLLPASILISAIIVSLALVYNVGKRAEETNEPLTASIESAIATALGNAAPLSADEHIQGDRNAAIVALEFSDLECPYCKIFHGTMESIMKAYPGAVALAFRHFPLDELHERSRKEAEAAECAGELGGNTAFWAYINKVFAITPSNDQLDPAELPRIAEQIGLKKAEFESCLASGRQAANVEADVEDGNKAGISGTPYTILFMKDAVNTAAKNFIKATNEEIAMQMSPGSPPTFVIAKDGKRISMNGALPYDLMKQIFDILLAR